MSFRHNDVEYLKRCERCKQTDCRRQYLYDKYIGGEITLEQTDEFREAYLRAVCRCRPL